MTHINAKFCPIEREVGLPNHARMILGAIRTGRKDARTGSDADASTYGARANSSWALWYKWGRDGLPMPAEMTRHNIHG